MILTKIILQDDTNCLFMNDLDFIMFMQALSYLICFRNIWTHKTGVHLRKGTLQLLT